MRQNGLIRDGLEFGNFRLYPSERLLLREGRRIAITPRVLDLLILLVGNPGELVDKETILDSIWGDTVVEEGNINRTVSTLRRQLGTQPNGNGYIETVPKIGYRFIAPVRTVLDQSPAEITSPLRSKAVWLLFPLAAFVLAGLILLFLWWSGPGELATKVLSGGETEPRRLTSEPGRYAYPTWADNDRIRFSYSGRNGRVERYIMDANGQNQQRIDPFAGRVSETLSPDGKRVYYWKQNDRAVYLADADGRNEKKLQFEPGSIAWSPDATKIVIQSIRKSAGSESANLLVYDPVLDTSAPVTEGTAVDADPSWSPDSKQIVFNSNRDGNFEIYLMNADGSNVRRLTNHPAWESHPAFSPDGTQIVFNSNREGDNYDVYLMNVDGSGLKKLTTWGSDEEIGPGCWSPDGTRIALVSNRYGDNDIYVLEVEPYRPQLLLADEKLNVRAAAISPDSTVVVYEVESG
jgi:TolB protein